MAFHHELRVRFNECDAQGIVFNAHYLTYFDITLTEMMRAAFGSYVQLVADHGVDLVVAEARATYVTAARFDDVLAITPTIIRLGTTGMTTNFRVSREGEMLTDGELRHVFVDAATLKKTAIPPMVREALMPFAA